MPRPKKKFTTSKKTSKNFRARPGGNGQKGTVIPGTDETFIRKYPGEDPQKKLIPDQRPDFETIAAAPDDEAAKHQYPPPKKEPIFRKMWMAFIDSIARRENFNISHLNNLEILCDLYVDYEDLRKFLRINGRSYKVQGRQGEIWKFFPEVDLLSKVLMQINNYTKLLGLVLKKDESGESDGEKANWD